MGGGRQGASLEQTEAELPDLTQELDSLWNAPVDFKDQMQTFDWSPLEPQDPMNYKFSDQSYLGPGNARDTRQSFEMLMDDLTQRIQARIEADRAQMGDAGFVNGSEF